MTMTAWRFDAEGVRIAVHVQPGAKRSGWAGVYGDALKVRLQAPPVDGKANEALRAWIAAAFGVPLAAVELVRGAQSRRKEVLVRCAAPEREAILTLLMAIVSASDYDG